ncbi:MAG TPA: radical SAM protein, partial [bacterium]|nr:radical SAM protein [bacterium]
GDPLLNSELKLMIEYIYKNFPYIFTCITTNGIALTSEKFGYLIENKIGFINVSINAATRKTYKRIMQVDCFDKVVENMIALQRYKQKMNSNLPELQMSFVANRLNIEELPILLEIAENVNCQKINIMYCRFYPSAIRNLNLISQENILKDEFSLFYHKDLSDKIIEEVKKRAIDKNIILTTEPLFKEYNKKFECCWPFKEILIGFNGEIYPCGGGELHFKEKIQKGIYDSGNILKEKIEDIWNKKFYLDLRKTVLENIETTEDCIIPECACCANRMIVNSKKSHIMEWVD